ncbi:Phage terminase, large subunit |uniref:terminase n=1 Tax=Alloactinosynnema sp. L-07 TaxID=1653480 RepID=UPI00065EF261|nr:terminase [Alloactinosynnema sp. L-07]CRK59064.1 Phage terminase, large subunit \
MPFKPEFPGERPTLGWFVLDWIADNLIVPDGPSDGEPLTFTEEQAQFVLKLYEVDRLFNGPAIAGRSLRNGRLVRRAMLSRPKGWGKSPLVGALCLVEALAEVVMDGWDADGRPVGRTWESLGFKPKVQIVAVSEDQTANTWEPTLDMARRGPVLENYNIDPMETMIVVPRGLIEAVTSSGTSREGFRPVFSVLDQTESMTKSNGGRRLAATVRRNLAKVNGCSVETPNAYEPGAESVAEKSFEAWQAQQEKKLAMNTGVLVDHREAPPETDPTDERSLRAGLAIAYGESADVNGGWVNLDRIVAEYWDPDTEPQDARRFYLNQITHATDSWLSQPEWRACLDLEKFVAPGEIITLGFDGSRKRNKGVTDATGLVGCRVSDGHLFELGVWEQPDGPLGRDWQVPKLEVDSRVREVCKKYRVIGFYADPAKWETQLVAWESLLHAQLLVKASRDHPIHWWMTGGRSSLTVQATEQLHSAIVGGECTQDGASALTRHMLNARRRVGRSGVQIAKEHPDSPRKIDLAVAAILAWRARLDAKAKGLDVVEESKPVGAYSF